MRVGLKHPPLLNEANSLENFTSSKTPSWFLQIICARLNRKENNVASKPYLSKVNSVTFCSASERVEGGGPVEGARGRAT